MRIVLLFVFIVLFTGAVFAQGAGGSEKYGEITQPYELRVFPNPATDSFAVVDNSIVDEIVMYNIIGKKMKTFMHESRKKYDISDLPEGMYFVSMISAEKGVLKTLRINKRVMRP